MRRFSPDSVASILKLLLTVVYYIGWVLLGLGCLLTIFIIFSGIYSFIGLGPALPSSLREFLALEFVVGIPMSTPAVATLTFVLNRLRRIVGTLQTGDPFDPSNVNNLRAIGAGLALFNVIDYASDGVLAFVFTLAGTSVDSAATGSGLGSMNLSGWISVVAFFVLAEAFREGTRLRDEQKFTI